MKFRIILIACLLGGAALTIREVMLRPQSGLTASFLAPHGETVLLSTPSGKTILIPGGDKSATLEEIGALLPFMNRKIDLLVLRKTTISDVAAAKEYMRRFAVSRILVLNESAPDSLKSIAATANVPLTLASPLQSFDLGDDVTLANGTKPGQLSVSFRNIRLDIPGDTTLLSPAYPPKALRGMVSPVNGKKTLIMDSPIAFQSTSGAWARNVQLEGTVSIQWK